MAAASPKLQKQPQRRAYQMFWGERRRDKRCHQDAAYPGSTSASFHPAQNDSTLRIAQATSGLGNRNDWIYLCSSMQGRSCEQAVPLSLMMKEGYSSEKSAHVGNHENTSEDSSSYEPFYDSLSDIQDAAFSNDLSAFLNEEEISRSLDLAHRSITNSLKGDEQAKQECTYYFNTSLNSPDSASSRETKEHDPDPSKRAQVTSPNSAKPLPEQKNQTTYPQEANNRLNVTGKQSNLSPLLPARPSFIRSLKNAEKCCPSAQQMYSKSKPASAGDVPFKNKLCDKAATLIEELSSIFREAAKTRVRSPDGNSSSPDSGYLSPKNKQMAMSKSLRSATSDNTCPEIIPESIPEVTPAGEPRKEGSQANVDAFLHQVTKESHNQLSPPRFIQKLRSQEVAEGNKVLLECRVAGNPTPHQLLTHKNLFCSVTKSCPIHHDPMDNIPPDTSVLHHPLESTELHTHHPSDPIQPPQPLLSPSFAFNHSWHQGLLQSYPWCSETGITRLPSLVWKH
ncbi:Palladin [Varanus komodoensis]|nr:Palladin [Varanus komodoensis]